MRGVLIALISLALHSSVARSATHGEVEVRRVIEDSNNAWIVAARTLDPVPLQAWLRDRALSDVAEQLEIGRESQVFISFAPPKIDFETITVDEQKGEASIQTAETWTYSVHELRTGACISRGGPNKSRVTYSLKRFDSRWLVFATVHEPLGERIQKLPCLDSAQQP